jgi:signal peptidase I
MVKRVIGLPGETIELRNNVLWVNGRAAVYEPLPDCENANPVLLERLDDIVHPVRTSPRTAAMRNFGPITVPAGEYFLMGDNRDSSRDSRYFGTVPRHVIVGRSSAVVFSLDPDHHYRLRGDRFLHEIP